MKNKKKLVLLFIGIILVFNLLVFIIGSITKNNLYKNAGDAIHNMMSLNSSEEADEDIWKDNWVRYNGNIYEYNQKILTFLVMGIDKREKVELAKDGISGGQSDALFLVVCNPTHKKISVISIDRNTMTTIDKYDVDGNYLGKVEAQITLQYGYGDGMGVSAERTKECVSNLFYNLPIHGYVSLNLGGITAVNDTLGGVEIEVIEDLSHINEETKVLVKGETVHLEGELAYFYLQYRDITQAESAVARLERQNQYISLLKNQLVTQLKKNPFIVRDLFNVAKDYMVTDLSLEEMVYIAATVLPYSFDINNMYSIDGETIKQTQFEEFYIDEQSLYDIIIQNFYELVEL